MTAMKRLKLLSTILLLPAVGWTQFEVTNPQNATWDWWSGGMQFDVVGVGTIDTALIEISLQGQTAKVEYSFWMRAIPDDHRVSEDNDSLELVGNFTVPESFVFNDIYMRMGDSIRHGRVLGRSQATTIYENLVYGGDPNDVPIDPALLTRDGETYAFRAFPVGDVSTTLVKLVGVVPLTTIDGETKEAGIPFSLFTQGAEPLLNYTVELRTSAEYSGFTSSGLSMGGWVNNGGGEYTYSGSGILPDQLGLIIENAQDHLVAQSHQDDSTGTFTMWSLAGDEAWVDPACNYLVMVDIDFDNRAYGSDEQDVKVNIKQVLEGLSENLREGDSIQLVVNDLFVRSWREGWTAFSSANMSDAIDFALKHAGADASMVNAAAYAAMLMEGQYGQIILLTNDFVRAEDISPQVQAQLISQLNQHRMDIFHMSVSPGHQYFRTIDGGFESLDHNFFYNLAGAGQGYYASGVLTNSEQAAEAMSIVRPATSVRALVNSVEQQAEWRMADQNLHTYLFSDAPAQADALSFHYSNGRSQSVDLTDVYSFSTEPCINSLYGQAMIERVENTYESQSVSGTMLEDLSEQYLLVSDYSALLVVEHDSQYNDTLNRVVLDWGAIPLEVEEQTEEDSEWMVYPNPVSDWMTVLLPNNDPLVRLTVVDLQGREVKSVNPTFGQDRCSIQVTDLPSGVYVVQGQFESGQTRAQRIIVP